MLNNGTILGDRYEVMDLIGSGGMADVYKAKDHKLNRHVAIKVLRQEYANDRNFVSKFRAEAQAAAGLMHPNIVNVYDVGEERGLYYFVMELVEGITLKHYIEKKIRLTVKEAVSIAIQVSMGIEAAHNNGIIHRDIKPQNIMISKEGKVKVADFGIAKAVSSDTITQHAMGSVHYTSPEQARGGYSDAKSDIYSIGITLFEMVTGHVPFDGDTTVAIAIKHIQTEMPSPRIYVPDVPISVEKIISKCCQKNPDRRYASTAELIADLKHSLMNPDEDFVVINNPASSEGTKTISDDDRNQIRSQTSMVNGRAYDSIIPSYGNQPQQGYGNSAGYNTGAGYNGANGYNTGSGYGNASGYNTAPSYNDAYGANRGAVGIDDEDDDELFNVRHISRNQNQYDSGYENGYGNGYEDEYEESPRRERVRREDDKRSSSKSSKSSKGGKKDKNKKKSSAQNSRNGYYEEDSRRSSRDIGRYYQDNEYYSEDPDDDVDPKMEKTITILMIILAVIITIVAIVVIGRVFGAFSSSSDGDDISITTSSDSVTVPDVVGKSVADASEALTAAGLTAKATYAESTEYEKDYIISQDIEPGTAVESGMVLNLVVSSGKVVGVTVPDVVGKTEAEAKVALENEGFTMQKQLQESSTVEKGVVISQSPLGAESAPSGSAITVVVSSGVGSSGEVEVPDLVGKDEATAKELLEAAGLNWSTVSEENNDSVPEGLVLSQTYAAGTMAPSGTTVDFTVSLGPESSTYSLSVTINAPGTYAEGSEAIVILMSNAGAEINRYSVTSFPYTLNETGIQDIESGYVTVTYLDVSGAWQTTSPVAVTFAKE